ncbi:MAG TPA: penicillin acylase family protein, partial [Vicinamibacterales bacterium]|nr:penicillin acylase family protein [Vicinamibacterales bacterium]
AIVVRAADGTLRQELRTFWRSHLGPIVDRTDTRLFAVKSTRLDAFRYFEGFYHLSRARSLREWMAALQQNLVPTSNFTYADADGNIVYVWNGRVPVRAPGRDYRRDVEARSTSDIWTTFHPLDELPQLLNPPGGYIQNANNPPRFTSLRDPIDMSRFPEYFERGPLALRPQLALDMLERQDRFSIEDVIRRKFDTRMLLAERIKRDVVDAVTAAPDASEAARAGAEALAAWDGRVSADSAGAALFVRFWDSYAAAIPQPFARPWNESDPVRTPAGLANPAEAVRRLGDAVDDMRAVFGTERAAWGEVNRFRIGAVDLPGEGAPGAYGCFRVMRFDDVPGATLRAAGNLGDGRRLTGFGDAWVLLVDFSGPVNALSILAYGQTTDLRSLHSRDQLRLFAARLLRPARYAEADVLAHVVRSYRP